MRLNTIVFSTLLFLSLSCQMGEDKSHKEDMTLRLELFTSNMNKSVEFYTEILGFEMEGEQMNNAYQPVKRGHVVLGIGPLDKLSKDHHFIPGVPPVQNGYGVEIVLEVDNITEVYKKVRTSGYPIHDPLKIQPWGLTDFRLVDPDGYYLRITSKEE